MDVPTSSEMLAWNDRGSSHTRRGSHTIHHRRRITEKKEERPIMLLFLHHPRIQLTTG